MKNLLLILTLLLPLTLTAQYNYQKPDISGIDITNMWEIDPNYNLYVSPYSAQSHLTSGLLIGGMSGLAFYFDTLGQGPYRQMGYFFGAVSVAKLTHAAIIHRRDKKYNRNIRNYLQQYQLHDE